MFLIFFAPILDLVSSLFTGSNTIEVIINSEIVQQIIRLFLLASTFSYHHLMFLRVYKCTCTLLFLKQTNDCFPMFKQTVVKLRFNRREYTFVHFYSVLDFNYRRQTLNNQCTPYYSLSESTISRQNESTTIARDTLT